MDTAIVAGAIAQARAYLEGGRLDGLGQIHRPVRTATPSGGSTMVWSPVSGVIRLGVTSGNGEENQYQQNIVSRIGKNTAYVILLPIGTDVRDSDRIYQSTPVARVFEVIGFENAPDSLAVLMRVVGIQLS